MKSHKETSHIKFIETSWFKVIVKMAPKILYKMSSITLLADATWFDILSSNGMTFRHFTMCPNTFWGGPMYTNIVLGPKLKLCLENKEATG